MYLLLLVVLLLLLLFTYCSLTNPRPEVPLLNGLQNTEKENAAVFMPSFGIQRLKSIQFRKTSQSAYRPTQCARLRLYWYNDAPALWSILE